MKFANNVEADKKFSVTKTSGFDNQVSRPKILGPNGTLNKFYLSDRSNFSKSDLNAKIDNTKAEPNITIPYFTKHKPRPHIMTDEPSTSSIDAVSFRLN